MEVQQNKRWRRELCFPTHRAKGSRWMGHPVSSAAGRRSRWGTRKKQRWKFNKTSDGVESYAFPPIEQKALDGRATQFHPLRVGEAGGGLERNKDGSSTKQAMASRVMLSHPSSKRRSMEGPPSFIRCGSAKPVGD